MKSICNLIVCAGLLIFAGCATAPDVHSHGGNSAQVRSSKTFALLPVTVDPNLSSSTATALAEAAQAGARDTLRGLGYIETNRESADLVFHLHGKSLEPQPVADWNYLPEPSKFGMKPGESETWANHRIYVEVYDNHSKRQVWMGWIQCSCRGIDPERVQHEIQRIVATFPPRNQGAERTAT